MPVDCTSRKKAGVQTHWSPLLNFSVRACVLAFFFLLFSFTFYLFIYFFFFAHTWTQTSFCRCLSLMCPCVRQCMCQFLFIPSPSFYPYSDLPQTAYSYSYSSPHAARPPLPSLNLPPLHNPPTDTSLPDPLQESRRHCNRPPLLRLVLHYPTTITTTTYRNDSTKACRAINTYFTPAACLSVSLSAFSSRCLPIYFRPLSLSLSLSLSLFYFTLSPKFLPLSIYRYWFIYIYMYI